MGAAGAKVADAQRSWLHDALVGVSHTHGVHHVPPGGSVHGSAGAQQTVLEGMQVPFACHILQEVGGEDSGVHSLRHGDLGQGTPAPHQTFYHQLGGLAAQRHQLQVEVTLPQAHFVQRGELQDNFLVDAQGPALVVQQQAFKSQLRDRKQKVLL